MQGDADEQADSGFETLSVPDSPAVMDYSVGDGAIGDGAVYVPVSPQLAEVPDGGQIGVQAGARPNRADLEEIVDDDIVETIAERLWGLTEMFPEKIRNATSILASATHTAAGKAYSLSRTLIWVFFSSAAILAAPVILELERVNMDEIAKQQQREILLGPSAAMAGHK
ncbi:mitochondrial import receptor subunit TOM22 homolog [Varroa jacobsoni]|uniref:Mitochondrial import receptor subunit TOM22 homolog n=1 Tax=Varroa destructor TaxID=109461 RepID=A0A7M7JIK6_VARDE|nr:mitochondrial import receptor subunit TOM22 homolog [Varroa destructor]XP_022652775.1 mitochondrial import receptor subunit TOM22 homolog [Varroa destructor]XP_022652776.1 mitochondrial import receptor subunit TOM22 homolog [Varroa destructor]XP_022686443.1 mitochondrial import receptor subunit TOM22 homolog [Varroa jacobsoni]XP_022686444.1 mitochondrial import receptor subunit TOM22 homolog [Varroa jacobsoni]XP_022686445.1 mitochondrial import receptor subunit TOM22 homolog [Varroa jacobso